MCAGCAHSPHEDGRVPAAWTEIAADGPSDKTVPWPFWPAKMRIHPLTRVAMDGNSHQLVIEARLEFLDADGHTTRAVGQVLFQLMADPDELDDAPPRRAWPEQDLRDLKVNRTRFDDVTSTYLFPIDVEESDLSGQPELRAYFLSADGGLMKARVPIRH
jgi:hypothetical protein